jgi:hypothetical protein
MAQPAGATPATPTSKQPRKPIIDRRQQFVEDSVTQATLATRERRMSLTVR